MVVSVRAKSFPIFQKGARRHVVSAEAPTVPLQMPYVDVSVHQESILIYRMAADRLSVPVRARNARQQTGCAMHSVCRVICRRSQMAANHQDASVTSQNAHRRTLSAAVFAQEKRFRSCQKAVGLRDAIVM